MKQVYGFLLGMTATVIWAGYYVVSRWFFGNEELAVNPFTLSSYRYLTAALLLSPILLSSNGREHTRDLCMQSIIKFIPVVFFGMILESFFSFYSLEFTTSARCSLLANASPIFTVLLAMLLLKTKPGLIQIAGMLIGFSGIVMAFFAGGGDIYAETGLRSLIGDGMALLGGVSWAYFTVAGTEYARRYGGLVCMFIGFAIATVISLPFMWISMLVYAPLNWTSQMVIAVVYTGIFSLGLANACWYGALKFLNPEKLGALGYVSAALTLIFAGLILNERFSNLFLCSIPLIFLGVALMLVPEQNSFSLYLKNLLARRKYHEK